MSTPDETRSDGRLDDDAAAPTEHLADAPPTSPDDTSDDGASPTDGAPDHPVDAAIADDLRSIRATGEDLR